MNIILIGMPACGKSCMGRALSKKLKMKLIDTDKIIEERTGKKLHELISNQGLDGFKKIEEETLLTISGDNLIISTGGSAVYYEKVMQHFKNIGKIIYLYVGLELLKERLGDFSKRGVVLKKGQTIDQLFEERTVLYRKYSDIIVNCNGTTYSRFQEDIIKALGM